MARHKVETYLSKREWEERQKDCNKYEQQGWSVWGAGGMHGNTVCVDLGAGHRSSNSPVLYHFHFHFLPLTLLVRPLIMFVLLTICQNFLPPFFYSPFAPKYPLYGFPVAAVTDPHKLGG